MITWLSSYPRSGNTFFRVLLNSIFDIKTYSIYDDRYDIGADKATSDVVGHVFLPDDFDLEAMRADKKMYIIKTHDLYDDKIDKDDKIIYLMRDGRESTLSFWKYSKTYTNYKRELNNFINMGTWGEHVKQWNPKSRMNTMLVKFEELVTEPQTLIKQIAEFSGLQTISEKIPSFEELQKINPKFFRSGKKDSWKEQYSDAEHLLFWSKNYHQMLEYNYSNNIPSSYINKDIKENIQTMPLISIITVNKNARDDLKKTIENIKSQTYPNIEYIIIDGNSDDGSKEIIDAYSDFVKYSISEKDNGIYDAMNKGVAQVSGKWTIFSNAGDLLVDRELLYSFVNNINLETDIYYGSRYIDKKNLQETEKLDKFYSLMPFGHQSAFIKTVLLKKYRFDVSYKLSSDYDFFLKCYSDDVVFENLNFPICYFDSQGLSSQLKVTSLIESLYVLSKYIDELELKNSIFYKSLSGVIFNEDLSSSSKMILRNSIKKKDIALEGLSKQSKEGKKELDLMRDKLSNNKIVLDLMRDKLSNNKIVLDLMRDKLSNNKIVLDLMRDKLSNNKIVLDLMRDKLSNNKIVLDSLREKLSSNKINLDLMRKLLSEKTNI